MKRHIPLVTCVSAAVLLAGLGAVNYYRAEGKPSFAPFSHASHEETETWMEGSFFLKDAFSEGYTALMQDTGSSENSGVYIGRNRLIEAFSDYDPDILADNIAEVDEFSKKHKLNLVLVPTASQIEKKSMPVISSGIDEKKLLDSIKEQLPSAVFADLLSTMGTSGGYFFRTDPHWNASGAKVCYEVICRDILKHKASDFRLETKNSSYYGPLYENSGAYWIKADEIEEVIPAHPVQITVKYNDGSMSHSLYDAKALETEDMYNYYLGGTTGKTVIETSVNTERKAVVLCDDYAHILIPYLVQEYSSVTLIHTNQWNTSISSVLKDEGNTDIFLVMSLKTFCTERAEFR